MRIALRRAFTSRASASSWSRGSAVVALKRAKAASSFAGKSRIAQHQAVYRALGELMDGPVHALSLKTFTPEAWAQK